MSIIHDALKKTQDKLNEKDKPGIKPASPFFNTNPTPATPPKNPLTTNKNNDNSSPKKRTIITVCFLIVFLGFIASLFIKKSPVKKTEITITSKPIVVESKSQPNNDQFKKLAGEIQFQGTASAGNSFAALINDDIYEEGQVINGMKIISIRKNELVLEFNGQEITLRTK